ncbi:MAG: site-2 protease family protein [Chloroflexota bacterium]
MVNPDLINELRALVSDLMVIDDVTTDWPLDNAVRFRGKFQVSRAYAHNALVSRLQDMNRIPLFRVEDGQDVILIMPHKQTQTSQRPWLRLGLFLATVVSVMFAGMQQNTGNLLRDILSGWPLALGLLGILATHEFGHYFAARLHKVPATLPLFLPMPFSILGTFGAVITLRGYIRDRRALLDIGAAGPLAGFVVALPVLFIGLSLSPLQQVGACPEGMICWSEGNSILYSLAKLIMFNQPVPGNGMDVMMHPLALAGWAGMLVTAMNLLPVGSLDGGHIAYALLGEKARLLYYPVLIGLVGLGFIWNGWWFWAVMVFFFGQARSKPLDDVSPVDSKRALVGIVTLALLILTFVPIPISVF